MKANLLDGGDEILNVSTRVVKLDRRSTRAQIDCRACHASHTRELLRDAADASLTSHSIHLQFDAGVHIFPEFYL